MKKLIFLSLTIVFSSFFSCFMPIEADAEKKYYAKVMYENVYLYSLAQNDDKNKLFEIPFSYFVLLHADENEDFYYAQYGDFFGYIQKSALSPMNGTPQNPYATTTFRVFSLDGLGLFKTPHTTSEKLNEIPYLSEDLMYYGEINGEEVIPDKTNKWIFAKHTKSGTFGYVYSVFCDKISPIQENKETFEKVDAVFKSNDKAGEELSPVAMTFIIIGVSLPCLIVLYLLVKPSMMGEKLKRSSHKLKTSRSRDYFEFDESDLN